MDVSQNIQLILPTLVPPPGPTLATGPAPASSSPVFTRYVYEKDEVIYSLLSAILSRERDEALFWAFELYYSGFVEEWVVSMRWLVRAYSATPRFVQYVHRQLDALATLLPGPSEEADCLVGSVVANFIHREYTLPDEFLVGIDIPSPTVPILSNLYIRFRPRDLLPYRTRVPHPSEPAWKYLRVVSVYTIRKPTPIYRHELGLSGTYPADDYRLHWLYYCIPTPIWQSRMSPYRSLRIDHDSRMVHFDSDEEMESFYRHYGFEPDEQPVEIHWAHGIYENREIHSAHHLPL